MKTWKKRKRRVNVTQTRRTRMTVIVMTRVTPVIHKDCSMP